LNHLEKVKVNGHIAVIVSQDNGAGETAWEQGY